MKAYTIIMIALLHWKYFYLLMLLISLASLALADWRYHLVFFDKPKAALKSIIGTMTILLIGDLIGIEWRVFSTNSLYVSGLYLGSPNLPIEEIFFLFLLCYFTLIAYRLIKKKLYV